MNREVPWYSCAVQLSGISVYLIKRGFKHKPDWQNFLFCFFRKWVHDNKSFEA